MFKRKRRIELCAKCGAPLQPLGDYARICTNEHVWSRFYFVNPTNVPVTYRLPRDTTKV